MYGEIWSILPIFYLLPLNKTTKLWIQYTIHWSYLFMGGFFKKMVFFHLITSVFFQKIVQLWASGHTLLVEIIWIPKKTYLLKHRSPQEVPSRELTYPTWGKGKSSSNCHFWGICSFPGGYLEVLGKSHTEIHRFIGDVFLSKPKCLHLNQRTLQMLMSLAQRAKTTPTCCSTLRCGSRNRRTSIEVWKTMLSKGWNIFAITLLNWTQWK